MLIENITIKSIISFLPLLLLVAYIVSPYVKSGLLTRKKFSKDADRRIDFINNELFDEHNKTLENIARFDAEQNLTHYSNEELLSIYKELYYNAKKTTVQVERIGQYDKNKINDLVEALNFYKNENVSLRKTSSLDEKTLKRIIRLCHPDKHNNSEVSNEVTSILLNMR